MAATSTQIRIASNESPALSRLEKIEAWMERAAPAIALMLVCVFGAWAWFASKGVRFQFDELLELAASSAPTNAQVLSFLAAGVDFNPPLSHFLIRVSMALFGASEWAARLPAFLGFVVLLGCLYSFLSRRLGRNYGIVAVLTLLCLPVRQYAIQARPYGLVLGLSGLVLVLYDQFVQGRHRRLALAGLAICTAALAAAHYYAVLVIAVVVAAEVVRAWIVKRADWAFLVCCTCPAMAVLWLLRDAIVQQRAVLSHYFARGNLLSFKHGYDEFLLDPLVYCVALILIVGILGLRTVGSGGAAPLRYRPKSSRELILPAGLLLLPILGAVLTQFVTHAYVPRYFVPAVIGFVICVGYAAKWFSSVVPCLALVLIVSLGLGFAKAALQEVPHQSETLPSVRDLTAESTPLLFDTPGTYLQTSYYFPALGGNLWVITDPSASLRYRQYDTDDKIMLALSKLGRAQTISLRDAVRRWPHFRLVPRSADYVWALKCVIEADAQIEVKRPFGNANFIFDVSVTPEQAVRIDACEAP